MFGKKAYDSESDASLIHAYLKGDEKAFETLYFRYRQMLYGYLNAGAPKSTRSLPRPGSG